MKGIYNYTDRKTNEVVYIGKDSHIDKNNRHNVHLSSSSYNDQPFNRVLQNNPERYEYSVVCEAEHYSNTYLNCLEKGLIKIYEPKFNFTNGGDGSTGYKHSEETKQKLSKLKRGTVHSDETRKKMSISRKNRIISDETRQKIRESKLGVPRSKETIDKICTSRNTTGYYRVSKHKEPTCKQGFIWVYNYVVDGKKKTMSNVDINTLKKRVIAQGLVWREL